MRTLTTSEDGCNDGLVLEWKRDLDSDVLVEYRIQDLPESRIDDVLNHLKVFFLAEEPLSEAYDAANKPDFVEDFNLIWRAMIKQRMPLVCFKENSNEIVGVNMIYVVTEEEHFLEKYIKLLKCEASKESFEIVFMLYENYNPFDKYSVDKYLTSVGLTVDPRYRGRGIGDHFLVTRKKILKEFNIKFTQTVFTSDFSNRNAEKAGYVLEAAIKFEDVFKLYPAIKNIKSKQMTIKTLHCD